MSLLENPLERWAEEKSLATTSARTQNMFLLERFVLASNSVKGGTLPEASINGHFT